PTPWEAHSQNLLGTFSPLPGPNRFTNSPALGIVSCCSIHRIRPSPPDRPEPGGIGEYRNKGEGMVWQHVRAALTGCALVAAAALPARADDCCNSAPCGAPCAPQYRTVCVKEWVPEQYQATRTVYKHECRTETYTAYRCESVPETRTRTVTCYKMVPEVQ